MLPSSVEVFTGHNTRSTQEAPWPQSCCAVRQRTPELPEWGYGEPLRCRRHVMGVGRGEEGVWKALRSGEAPRWERTGLCGQRQGPVWAGRGGAGKELRER